MKKITNLFFVLVFSLFLFIPTVAMATAGDMIFSYDRGNGTQSKIGNSKKENYNVAIRLDGKGLAGVAIKGVRIPLAGVSNISNLNVWLTTQLKTKTENSTKVNDADILTQEAVVTDDWVEVTFDNPYTLTGEDVYVGYSFNIDNLDATNKLPIVVTSEGTGVEGGLYMFTSRTYRSWQDRSVSGSSAMQVLLTNAKANAATLTCPTIVNGEKNKETSVDIKIFNQGYEGVSSFDYTFEVNGMTGMGHIDLGNNAIGAILNASTDVTLTIPALPEKGNYPLILTITKVNNVDNEDADPSATSSMMIYGFVPKHRAVLEEYTGMWCGYCPRGFVGLEVMNRLHPDDFIGISYHNGDAMEIMTYDNFPSDISGYPAAFLDRNEEVDAYYGSGSKELGIEDAWLDRCKEFAPASVELTAKYNEDCTMVQVETEVMFPFDYSSVNYKVETILLSDDLYNESWGQSNYYAGYGSGVYAYPEFDVFTAGASTVTGLHFDDVIISTTRLSGNDVALPNDVEADKTYSVAAQFSLAEAVTTSQKSLVQNLNNLRVVALLIDGTTGKIVNANKCAVTGAPESITSVSVKTEDGKDVIYDLAGHRLNKLTKGINIIKSGSGSTKKVLNK